MPTYQTPEDADNELHKLLLRASPVNEHGNKTLSHLAKTIGVTRWAMQKWILNERIPPDRVVQIVDVSDGRVSISDFDRFVYKL